MLIGLKDIYFADITEDSDGNETYGTPYKGSEAMTADISMNGNTNPIFGDDREVITIPDNGKGTLTIGMVDLLTGVLQKLTGATIDDNGALVAASEDLPKPKAVGFRSLKANGKYRYFWLYRVTFAVPNLNMETKGESINVKTPSIVGTFKPRNKVNEYGKHPWKTEITEGDTGVTTAVTSAWFESVYEPVASASVGGGAE